MTIKQLSAELIKSMAFQGLWPYIVDAMTFQNSMIHTNHTHDTIILFALQLKDFL